MRTCVTLLSGGMDSAVAAFWAAKDGGYDQNILLTIDYQQKAWLRERDAAVRIARDLRAETDTDYAAPSRITHCFLAVPGMFGYSGNSIVARHIPVNKYADVEEAVAKTAEDQSYIPLRNAVFLALAASVLLTHNVRGGDILTGIRARPDGSGGFPDCTSQFANSMSAALSEGSGAAIQVLDILNHAAPSRAQTIVLAQSIPGCLASLRHTVSCFEGGPAPCGHCLPCLRRAQAFAAVGIPDPAGEQDK